MRFTPRTAPFACEFLYSLIGLSLLGVTRVTAAEAYHPRVGQPHAEFTLPAIDDGRPVSLSDFRGKKVLLIHFASW